MANLKEIADKANSLFNAHDATGLAELDADEVVQTIPGPSGRQKISGKDAVRDYQQAWFDGFPDARITIVTELVGDDCVITEGLFEGTHTGTFRTTMGDIPATNKSVKGGYVLVSKFNDEGKGISANLYFDLMQFMVDLGLTPAPEAVPATA